jgi:eukaryotic-like serine/threonine-protein kinase
MANTASFPAVAMRKPASGIGLPLGRYMLLDRIGEGGMAEIFTAVSFGSSGFRRSFVIKRLRPEMASSPMAVAHFIDEANLASTLVHPNIVPVFDFGEVGGAYFLAQEYIVGRDLGRLTRRMVEKHLPPLSPSAALYVAHEALRGLHYAHEKHADDGTALELVHRDVTPENIMISERGEVKMLDFGIVKAAQRVAQTDIGIVKGNVDFMAPEQARGRPVDRRADVFSVGLVIYFAVARKPLYDGETLFDRLTRAAQGPGDEERARIAALPAPLPDLLQTALAIDPDERFDSALAFAQAIASHPHSGAAELTGVINAIFGDELALEQDRLAAAFPRVRRETDPAASDRAAEGDGKG